MPSYLSSVPNAPTWLKRHKKNGRFYVRIRRKRIGGRKEHALPETIKTVREAMAAGERYIAQESGFIEKPKALVRNESLLEEILQYERARAESGDGAFKTYSTFSVADAHVRPWLNEFCPYAQDLTELVCNEKYVAAQRKLRPGKYLGNEIKLLRRLIKRAFQYGLLAQRFSLKTIDEDSDESPGVFIPIEEQDRLLELGTPAMRMKCALGLTMGLRNKESRVLELEQFDQGTGVLRIRAEQTKVRRSRSARLSPLVDAMLDLYRGTLPKGTPYLFPLRATDGQKQIGDQKKAWYGHRDLAKCSQDYRFHDLRVTYLTSMGLLGVPAAVVCKSAGLAVDVYEKRYLKPPEMSAEEFDELMEKLMERADRLVPQVWRRYVVGLIPARAGGGKVGETVQTERGEQL